MERKLGKGKEDNNENKKHFSLQLLGLVTILLIGTVSWTGCQGCEMQPGMSPEGWCCRGDEVFPCIEHECYDGGGDFFPTEHEAIAHCEGQMPPGEGWCCDAGNVAPCSEAECLGWGGAFFLYEHEAIAHCGGPMPPGAGWCCDAGNVMPASETECFSWGGDFFPTEHEAQAHCGGPLPPGGGWCCDAGNVAPCSEAECLGWGGVFFLYEHEAIAHCQGTTPGPSPGPAPAGSPVINYFTANPSTITGGQSSTLKWDVSGANTVGLTAPGFKVLNPLGTTDLFQVSPTATKVYTLTATNSAGTVTDTAQVTVTGSAPPGGGGWSGPPKVTNVTANAVPPSYTGPGPTTINFVAAITVAGPCTVTYKWERSDGVIGLQQTLVFSAAGAQQVSDTWTLGGGPGTGIVWERVSILTPLPMLSNKAQFTLNITP